MSKKVFILFLVVLLLFVVSCGSNNIKSPPDDNGENVDQVDSPVQADEIDETEGDPSDEERIKNDVNNIVIEVQLKGNIFYRPVENIKDVKVTDREEKDDC